MLRVPVPRKLRWPHGSHQDPRSPGAPAPPIIHPRALKGGARLSLQVTLLYGPELGGHHARPASSVEAVTYERTQCEAHSLMAVTGLGEPRRVSLRRLQLGGHVAHCEARGLFFELLEKKKKSLSLFPPSQHAWVFHAALWLAPNNDHASKPELSLLGLFKIHTYFSLFHSHGSIPEYSSARHEMKIKRWIHTVL